MRLARAKMRRHNTAVLMTQAMGKDLAEQMAGKQFMSKRGGRLHISVR